MRESNECDNSNNCCLLKYGDNDNDGSNTIGEFLVLSSYIYHN